MNDSSLPDQPAAVAPASVAPSNAPAPQPPGRTSDPVAALPAGVFYALSEPRRDAWTRIVAAGDPGPDAAAALAAAHSAQATGALNADELFDRAAKALEAAPWFAKSADGQQLVGVIRSGEASTAST